MVKSTSLCMITKDEGKNLADCLNSVKNIVGEIIIVDTGSTDDTKEIAKKFKAKVFDFKWVDDFSAARNESLKHATKDWILVLDADETLDPEGVKAIKGLVDDKKNDAFLFVQKNYSDKASITGFVNEKHKKGEKTYAGWYASLITRLFRNKKGYKFDGTVHELVEPSIESKKGKIGTSNVVINHYGNADPAVANKKKQFYLELCRKKVKQKPDADSHFELGVLYKENDNIDEAIKSLKKAAGLNPKHRMALFELGIIYEQQKKYDDAIKNYTKSLRIKEDVEAFQNLGVCYLKKGELKEAYRNLTKALILNPNKYTIYNSLGAALEKAGNFDQAVQMLEIGIKLNPNNVIGYYNLGIALDKKGRFGEAMRNYEKAVALGHRKKEEIKKRIRQLRTILINEPEHKYSFNIGG